MKHLRKIGLGALLGMPLAAFATGPASPDLSALTPDFSTVTTAIVAIATAVVAVYVTWKGAKLVLRAVRGL
jgi:hypothetical protein